MRESDIRKLGKNWYKDKNFWNLFAPLMFNEARWQKTEAEITNLIHLLEVKKDNCVLDACCGVGRHSIELAKRGILVTGIDITQNFIEAAAQSAEAEGVVVNFIESDILKYRVDPCYDYIINMYTSFGYFDTEKDDALFLKNMHGCLKTGGRILIETMGKEVLSRDFKESEWYEHEGSYVLAGYEIIDHWTKLKNRWVIVTEDCRYDYTFSHRVYSAAELMKMMQKTGFYDIRVYGDLEGNPYDHRAESLVITGMKK